MPTLAEVCGGDTYLPNQPPYCRCLNKGPGILTEEARSKRCVRCPTNGLLDQTFCQQCFEEGASPEACRQVQQVSSSTPGAPSLTTSSLNGQEQPPNSSSAPPVAPSPTASLSDGQPTTANPNDPSAQPVTSQDTPSETTLAASSSVNSSTQTGFVPDTTDPAVNNGTLPSETPQSTNSGSGLSGGAAAGIGVGIALVAIIAGIALFLFLRRRRANKRHEPSYYNQAAFSGQEKPEEVDKTGFAVTAIPAGVVQPSEDSAITGGLSKLRDKLKNHVQAFYHSNTIAEAAVAEENLLEWATVTGVDTTVLKSLLLAPSTREAALRSYLAAHILSRSNGQGRVVPSLLPSQVAAAARDLNSKTGSEAATAIKWKTETARSLRKGRSAADLVDPQAIAGIIDTVQLVVQPFVKPENATEQRTANLESVLRRAGEFGLLLFGEPSLWGYDWKSSADSWKQSAIVVMPALQQLASEDLRALKHPKVFCKAEVVQS